MKGRGAASTATNLMGHRLSPLDLSPPSWKERPEEVLEAIRWARENDTKAKRIAGNGQRLALE